MKAVIVFAGTGPILILTSSILIFCVISSLNLQPIEALEWGPRSEIIYANLFGTMGH